MARTFLEIIGLGKCNRLDAQKRAFDRAGDRSGIGYIIGNVLPGIDARQNQIGWTVHDFAHTHNDTIGWCSVEGELVFGNLAQPQRIAQGKGMREAGLVGFRCHCPDLIGKLAGNLFQRNKPPGIDAVIVGQQYLHLINPPSQYVRARPCKAAGNREP